MESHLQIINPPLRTVRANRADDSFQLLKLWRAIWQRKWPIAALVVIVTLVAVVAVSVMTPVYRATATLVIDEKKNQVVTFSTDTAAAEGSNSQYLETQAELIRSRSLATNVVKDLDLAAEPQFAAAQKGQSGGLIKGLMIKAGLGAIFPSLNVQAPAPTGTALVDGVTRQFMDTVTVEPQGKSQLVKVQVEMIDPNTAAKAANALVQGYIESQNLASVGSSQTASTWMNGRLEELGKQLKDSEARLQAYREQEGLVDVKGVGTISAAELAATSERMIDARRARAEAESQFRQVQGMRQGGWERLVSVPAVMADPVVQQFKAEQAKAGARLDELSSRYGPQHPAMEAARSQFNAATASLKGQVEQVVAGIERNYQLAAANEGSLKSSVNTNKSQIQDISRKEFKLQALQREVDSNLQLYDTFMTRLKETAATGDLDSTNTRIVDLASVPSSPIKPNKPLIVVLAALLATMVGCGLALLKNALRNTFTSPEEVEGRLNLPVLGIVPLMKSRKRKDLAKLFSDQTHHRFSESIRSIRTGVVLASPADRQHQFIMMTSTVPGEGKTTVCINLARALGRMERVLLIDADLRRPTLAEAFGIAKDAPGLTDMINGTALPADCIRQIDGIDVLCSGTFTSTPLELLSSPQFAQVLDLLKGKYHRIVIDSPPVQPVSDAMVLSTFADSIIYVVKSPTTSVTLAQKGISQLLQHNAPLKGVVMNYVDIKKSLRSGQRFDGYYDYYGYSSKTP